MSQEIPSSKVARAMRFVKTGVNVGGNYVKHYSQKLLNPELDREELDKKNAQEIYTALSELKGSALKAAQMLSMDTSFLPQAYIDKFTEAQYQAPALSGPLVVKTFEKQLGKTPQSIFEKFEMKAIHAASMGQVHLAELEGKKLAIKIQYPGVGESVVSDLNIIRPIAGRLFGWKDSDLDVYFDEVKERLLEETDYELELRRGTEIAQACKELEGIFFPTYYAAYSAKRILTMDFMEGKHLDSLLAENPSQEIRNALGQKLWDFYNFQVHKLKMMHADAHPGNFLFRMDGTLGVLDFGCIKELPEDFYQSYFALLQPGITENEAKFKALCLQAGALLGTESPEEETLFMEIFREAVNLLCKPFHQAAFDFGEESYFAELYAYGEKSAKDPALRKSQPRGSQHGLYMNRAYFGLFMILHKLKAVVNTQRFMPDFHA